MSIKHMNAVWTDSIQDNPTQLLALLKLADIANDAGYAWPGIPTIAQAIRQSERNTSRVISKIEKTGELYVDRRKGRGSRYVVCVNRKPGEIAQALAAYLQMTPEQATNSEQTIVNLINRSTDKLSVPTSGVGTTDIAVSADPSLTSFNNGDRTIREKEDYINLLNAVVMVCRKLDPLTLSEKDLSQIDILYQIEVDSEAIKELYSNERTSWWRQRYWKGKKGQFPTPADIRETMGQALDYYMSGQDAGQPAEEAWQEVEAWLRGTRQADSFTSPRTLEAIKALGEGYVRKTTVQTINIVRSKFLEAYSR